MTTFAIEETGELLVSVLAEETLKAPTIRLDWVTPAIIIPTIKRTIDNSIKENAFFVIIIFAFILNKINQGLIIAQLIR